MNTMLVAAALALSGAASDQPGKRSAHPLAGEWTVDLRPAPSAPAYLKPMVLNVAADGSLSGTFYDNAIQAGRADAANRICFAFRTADPSGLYQTSGCLEGGEIEGQTWSEGRGFLLSWSAKRP
ncbi:MAG TPA: hypothetical protein VEZ48_09695 [Sphingomonadaceae bacterium]|nr:hypothetical protein [Sphingomonadaceae bacterium]